MTFLNSINPLYSSNLVLKEMRKSYEGASPKLLRLPTFLGASELTKLRLSLETKGDFVKVADRYAYFSLEDNREVRSLFSSAEFLSFLSAILGKKVGSVELSVRRYAHGCYTLLHDSEKLGERIEFFFILTRNWDGAWGGNKIYTLSEGEEPLVFPAEDNCFSLIHVRRELASFLQYITHHAGKESFIVIGGSVR